MHGHESPVLSARNAGPCFLHGLLLAACATFSMVVMSVHAQVPPGAAEAARYTGLHAAAHGGDVVRIEALIKAGEDVNRRDRYGRTALHIATFARKPDAVRALIKGGAKTELLENDKYDAVTVAAVADDEATLRVLLANGASAKLTTSRYDGTALIAAAHLGHDGVVTQLIAAGAPLDHVNNLHWTALIESIVLGNGGPRHVETLRVLVKAGANLQLTDRDRRTPLALARARGYTEMVKILLEAGAK
jgi:uncharacterized protein